MTDYYPLISRAIGGLDKNTGENRRALYERARGALVAQLRSIEPPLDESDVTRERLALEEAIRKVESDTIKRAHMEEEAPGEAAEERPASLRDQALREFRETMAEAEGLGEATTEANRSARETYAHVPGGEELREDTGEPAPAEHYFDRAGEVEPEETSIDERAAGHAERAAWPPPPEHFEDELEVDEYERPERDWRRIGVVAVVVLLVLGIAGTLYWKRSSISSMMASLRSAPSAPAPKPQQASPAQGQPKIADRIGPSSESGPSSGATAPAIAVAQKVVLYEEDPSNAQGKRFVGSAIWRTETVSPGPGLAPELAIRADVEIPERRMRMTWSLRRNTDKALPASHTIEVMFTLPADFDQGGIGNVPGVLMKQNEQARGVPLAGLAVKVTNGYFLIGLSAVEIDVQRNIQLLKERDWFDVPVVYTSGKRAILALEKGTPGARAFEEAFRAWGE